MARVSFYLVLTALGVLLSSNERLIRLEKPWWAGLSEWEVNLAVGALGGLALAVLASYLSAALTRHIEAGATKRLINALVLGLVGAATGLLAGWVFDLVFSRSALLTTAKGILLLLFSIVGLRVGHRDENILIEAFRAGSFRMSSGLTKLLDTSVIIDGRIGDLTKTGFIEGRIIIPQFVLDELHNIADSSDNLRRRKGRRGLDILGELRRNPDIEVETLNRDYTHLADVDRKLIQLAKDVKAKIITTDYNLNKVAKVEGIPVLNINELANAVKPRFIPGEELDVEIIDRGEEIGQGIGYLDDGTMVVVENGRRFIGKRIRVIVNSSLQTEAGKMLFVRPKLEVPRGKWEE